MHGKKDSLGREFLAAETVYRIQYSTSPDNILSPAGDLITTSLYPELCIKKAG